MVAQSPVNYPTPLPVLVGPPSSQYLERMPLLLPVSMMICQAQTQPLSLLPPCFVSPVTADGRG
jgi:hypothetical protein